MIEAGGVQAPGNAKAPGDLFKGIAYRWPTAPAHALVFLKLVASGAKHRNAYAVSGISNIDVVSFSRVDDAFKAAYSAALQMHQAALAHAVLDAATERAVEGVEEPVIGRIGKDLDGIITTRRRFSDRLAESLLKGTDKRFREDRTTAAPASGITYNIQINQAPACDAATDADRPEKCGKSTENTEKPNKSLKMLEFEDLD